MDLSKLSTDELLALRDGDLTRVSTQTLKALQAESGAPGVSDAYREGREAPGAIRGLLSVAGGPTFGFADELAGAVGGAYKAITNPQVGGFSEQYRNVRDYVRGAQDYERDENPMFTGVTQMMASAPMMVAAPLTRLVGGGAGAMAPTGVVNQAGQAARAGAVYGGLSGAGNSTADDLSGVARDSATGAMTSAAISAAAIPAQRAVSAIGGNVAARISDSSALNHAKAKIAEALSRDGRGSVVQSGASNPLLQARARFDRLGDEAVVADAGGQNTRQLLDTLATLPGKAKQATESLIHSRQAGRAGRLVSAADDALRTKGAGFSQTVEALDAARRKAAAPYYERLQGLTAEVDDDVLSLLGKTMGIHGEAQKLYRLQTGEDVILGALKKGDQVPFAVLDTLKQSLYDAAEVAKRQGNNKMARAIDEVRVQLTGKLDDVAPKLDGHSVYKLARDAYAGPSQLIDAAELGRAALKADSFDVTSSLKGMSNSELEAFRVGALQALREKSGTQAGQSSLLRMWSEPATRDRLKAIFGSDYRAFAAEVAKEARLKGLESVGRGSQTASRMYAAGDLDVSAIAEAGQAAMNASSGNMLALLAAGGRGWNRVATPEPVRNKLSEVLLSGGATGRNHLTDLLDLTQRINADRARLAEQAGFLFGQGGNALRGGQP